MYNDKRILAIIPARGRSKGIPHKNIRELCKKPLINYTIEAALKSGYCDCVFVSTDDVEIANIAKKAGATVSFLRPPKLATDTAKTIDAVCYTLDKLGRENYDILLLLQPTSPLRDSIDIKNAIEFFVNKKIRRLVSISPVNDNPILIRDIDENDNLHPLFRNKSSTLRRQDFPVYYHVNGAIYLNYIDDVTSSLSFNDNSTGFIMKKEHSIDIDDEIDLKIAEFYLENKSLH